MADILNRPIIEKVKYTEEPIVISKQLEFFFSEADFGPLYNQNGEVIENKLQDILTFLDPDDVFYRITNINIIILLIKTYVWYHDLLIDYHPNYPIHRFRQDFFLNLGLPTSNTLDSPVVRLSIEGLRKYYSGHTREVDDNISSIPFRKSSATPSQKEQLDQYLKFGPYLNKCMLGSEVHPLDDAYEVIGLNPDEDEDYKIEQLYIINPPLFSKAVNDEIECRLNQNLLYLRRVKEDKYYGRNIKSLSV